MAVKLSNNTLQSYLGHWRAAVDVGDPNRAPLAPEKTTSSSLKIATNPQPLFLRKNKKKTAKETITLDESLKKN